MSKYFLGTCPGMEKLLPCLPWSFSRVGRIVARSLDVSGHWDRQYDVTIRIGQSAEKELV